MEQNSEEISSIEVVYFIPSKIINVKSFSPNIKFKDIINYFKSTIRNKNQNLELKKDYYLKNNKLNESTNILDTLKERSISEKDKIKLYIELIDTKDNKRLSYILKPKNNPFGIIAFSAKDKAILTEDFDKDIIDKNNLDKYNPEFSSYCNSDDSIFISGGYEKNNELSEFWIINIIFNEDNNSYNIKSKKMPSGKKEHSMIYNKLNDLIFIVGGNDKKCFVYDIIKDKFSQIPELIEICLKPGLFIKNKFLYVFDSFERKKKYFQKLNLEKMEQFEKFTPKNYTLNDNKFFGICETNNDDNIIFCGGERTGANTIIYDFSKNDLFKTKGKDINCKLNDKIFHRINQNYSINIPDSKDRKEKSIIAIDLRTNDAFKIMFDNEGKTTFKMESNEENDISIDPLIETKKIRYSLNIPFSKEISDKKNKEDEITFSQNMINYENNSDINSDDIKLKLNIKKRNLPDIKSNSESNEIEGKNNKNEILELDNLEINCELEANEKESDKKILYKYKQPKLIVSGQIIEEQYTNVSIDKKEEKNNEDKNFEDKNENQNINSIEINNYNNIEDTKKKIEIEKLEKKIGSNKMEEIKNKNEINAEEEKQFKEDELILKTENKPQFPLNLKLAQSNIFFSNPLNLNNSKDSSINNSCRKRDLTKSVYLYDDSSLYNKYNNYLYHEMIPNFKKKNRIHLTPNLEKKLKNPITKSKTIKKKEINGINYAYICEKIIDKSNFLLSKSLNVNENYSIVNDLGNHKLLISQYNTIDNNDIFNINLEKKKREAKPHIQNYSVNEEKMWRNERSSPPLNIIPNYNYLKEKNSQKCVNDNENNSNDVKNVNIIRKISEDKNKVSNGKYLSLNERKNEPIINFINERIIEPSEISIQDENIHNKERKKINSDDKFEPTKLRSAERKTKSKTPEKYKTKNSYKDKDDININYEENKKLIIKENKNIDIIEKPNMIKENEINEYNEIMQVIENNQNKENNEDGKLKEILDNENKNDKTKEVTNKEEKENNNNKAKFLNIDLSGKKDIEKNNIKEEKNKEINMNNNVDNEKNFKNKEEQIENKNNEIVKYKDEKGIIHEENNKVLNDSNDKNNIVLFNNLFEKNNSSINNKINNNTKNNDFEQDKNYNIEYNNKLLKIPDSIDNNLISEEKEIKNENGEYIIENIKKKKTKLIEIIDKEAIDNDNDKDNEILLENSFIEKEKIHAYKEKLTHIRFYIPHSIVSENIFEREIINDKKENIKQNLNERKFKEEKINGNINKEDLIPNENNELGNTFINGSVSQNINNPKEEKIFKKECKISDENEEMKNKDKKENTIKENKDICDNLVESKDIIEKENNYKIEIDKIKDNKIDDKSNINNKGKNEENIIIENNKNKIYENNNKQTINQNNNIINKREEKIINYNLNISNINFPKENNKNNYDKNDNNDKENINEKNNSENIIHNQETNDIIEENKEEKKNNKSNKNIIFDEKEKEEKNCENFITNINGSEEMNQEYKPFQENNVNGSKNDNKEIKIIKEKYKNENERGNKSLNKNNEEIIITISTNGKKDENQYEEELKKDEEKKNTEIKFNEDIKHNEYEKGNNINMSNKIDKKLKEDNTENNINDIIDKQKEKIIEKNNKLEDITQIISKNQNINGNEQKSNLNITTKENKENKSNLNENMSQSENLEEQEKIINCKGNINQNNNEILKKNKTENKDDKCQKKNIKQSQNLNENDINNKEEENINEKIEQQTKAEYILEKENQVGPISESQNESIINESPAKNENIYVDKEINQNENISEQNNNIEQNININENIDGNKKNVLSEKFNNNEKQEIKDKKEKSSKNENEESIDKRGKMANSNDVEENENNAFKLEEKNINNDYCNEFENKKEVKNSEKMNEILFDNKKIKVKSIPKEKEEQNLLSKKSNTKSSNLINQLDSNEFIQEDLKIDEKNIEKVINNLNMNNNIKNIEENNTIKCGKNEIDINMKDKNESENVNRNYDGNIREKNINIIFNEGLKNIEKESKYEKNILSESPVKKIDISKEGKFNNCNSPLTLFELMDQPSNYTINIDFPEIKQIKFSKNDFGGKNNKAIKKLIRNGIPEILLLTDRKEEKGKKLVIYTPQKIKIGKRFLITKRENNNTYIKNNENKINIKNIKSKNINIYDNKNKIKKNNFIDSSEINKENIFIKNHYINDLIINKKGINDSNEININEAIDNDDDLINNKKSKKFYKVNKTKNELNNMEINANKRHQNNLKEILKINSKPIKRSKTPIFKKKIDILNSNNCHIKITNLGGVKIKNNIE